MNRRAFMSLIGGATAWPLAARAQQPGRLIRIGFLTLNSGPTPNTDGFQHGLRQLGYVEGQNLVLLYRWAAGRRDRLVDLANELLQLKVEAFASNTTEAIMAIRTVNKTIPVIMTGISDPVGNQLVASFARPGGHTTGVTLFSTELAGKRLDLLKEVVPRLARVAVLAERDHPPTASLVSSKPRRLMHISGRSPTSRSATACRPFTRYGTLSKLADSWPMGRADSPWASARPGTWTES